MQTHSETLCHLGWSKLPFDLLYRKVKEKTKEKNKVKEDSLFCTLSQEIK